MQKRSSLLSLFAAVVAGCTAPAHSVPSPSRTPPEPVATSIADRLVDAAELRANLSHMRVLVHFRPAGPRERAVVPELERELVPSLARRMHLFDASLAPNEDLEALVERLDVTHVLFSDTTLEGNAILLSLRLVEHTSLHIVASVRGSIPLATLSQETRLALTRVEEQPNTLVPVASPPLTDDAVLTGEPDPALRASLLADADDRIDVQQTLRANEIDPQGAPAAEGPTERPGDGLAQTESAVEGNAPPLPEVEPAPKGPAYHRLKSLGRRRGKPR